MVDHSSICCMCGDIGFPDKLFLCTKCRSRFQHSYCTNYYAESMETNVCDWCRSEERSAKQAAPSRRSSGKLGTAMNRSEYSGERIKQNGNLSNRGERSDRARNVSGSSPSPRPSGGRKYKLLKDVLC